MKKFFTYILYSESKLRHYIGSCSNLYERLSRHNKGMVKSTKYGVPWKITYFEEFPNRQEAYKREYQIKSYKGGTAFKELLNLQ